MCENCERYISSSVRLVALGEQFAYFTQASSALRRIIRETNSGYGLKSFSEKGTESCNKLVRK